MVGSHLDSDVHRAVYTTKSVFVCQAMSGIYTQGNGLFFVLARGQWVFEELAEGGYKALRHEPGVLYGDHGLLEGLQRDSLPWLGFREYILGSSSSPDS